ncbi:hypothetical protein Y032_0031g2439 [Ancylostoma ceylanicum]|uniref:Reverse transcriptase domain-containing protein n=1 Tax=Ancylostoma ceylanicum TaxID=53326 RepID=A0A016UPP3_9BILA|nr:hypothetical protein Y032_0031g2439 [Ancylostoma ceylanicum]
MLDAHGQSMEMYGLSRRHVVPLIKERLGCNIFKWSGNYYCQQRGLAMGQRLAPVLAISFMSKTKEPVLSRFPLMYCRYIGDCCIVTSTQSGMDECFRILNQQSQYIKLTRETPRHGWFPYLNTPLMLCNGVIRVKCYRKESSTNIIVHTACAHPVAVKRAVINNMLKTATNVGKVERQESLNLASSIV